mmetsp:Transcript_119461/g.273715  ORF Transcript_119461/g.273715 Transcript_119461/m.273715 type:complete len:202 (-) Transcript_119461:17-622(-)
MSFVAVLGRDVAWSNRIHQLSLGGLDYPLLLPALITSYVGVPLMLLGIFVCMGWRSAAAYLVGVRCTVFLFWGCHLLVARTSAQVLATLLSTSGMKRVTNRERPRLEHIGLRKVSIRGMETNKSFPSGDSAQACLFFCFLAAFTGKLWVCFGIPAVMFARVYFGFHFIADTVFGAWVGFLICVSIALPAHRLLVEISDFAA